ncbi:unannotated protein [freshwater metagenome]|uniref:Unannotated protein n=1 Tax=freshwater metagenome TaxID=449393 RepID=A0A6J6E168_9ZZZZ
MGKPQYNSLSTPISHAENPAEIHAAVWLSPRYSRNMSPNRQIAPTVESGILSDRSPAYKGRPSGFNGSTARCSKSSA